MKVLGPVRVTWYSRWMVSNSPGLRKTSAYRLSVGRKSIANSFEDCGLNQEAEASLQRSRFEIQRLLMKLYTMKAGSFPAATHPLLETYCMCVSRARFIEKALRETDITTDFRRFKMLSNMQARSSAMIAMLATRLRILPRNNPRQNRHESPYAKPWEIRPE
jgi:hypothetical protein